jgi:serine/threonine-protein kinase
MAPEQVRGESVDARTDVWALGVLLYEMVSGRQPFRAPTAPAMFVAILQDAPAALPPTVPQPVSAIVARCLEKDPGRRYQRAADVRSALRSLDSAVTTAVPVPQRRFRRGGR